MAAVPGGTVWGTAGYVIKSADGGLHWRRVGTQSHLSAVAARSARLAWAVGPKGLIIHTSDGGRHWTAQRSGTIADLTGVVFVDAVHGWVAGHKVILRTGVHVGDVTSEDTIIVHGKIKSGKLTGKNMKVIGD